MADAQLTPVQWRDRLDMQLELRRPRIDRYQRYYDGEHRLQFATAKFREVFGHLFEAFADNWCEMVVDVPVERLQVQGFRFGDEDADDDAWEMWQANDLDGQSAVLHTEAVKCGEAYTIVAPPDSAAGQPVITVEHPDQVIVATSQSSRRVRLAAWKKWLDDSGYVYGTLYLPDAIYKWQSKSKPRNGIGPSKIAWQPRAGDEGGDNPLGVVPVVPFYNNPKMLTGGRSDLRVVIPMQDAANKLITDMMVASEFAAFRQRVASGLEIPEGMSPQEYTSTFVSAVSRLWTVPDENVNWTEFAATDLANYTHAIEMIVQHIAAQTRTPPHYLLGQVVNLSADALKAAETGLVAKVQREQLTFGESWEETARLGFIAKHDVAKAETIDCETLWGNPESRTEAQKADAAVKMQQLGVPWATLMEFLGYSPQKIKRMREERMQDAEMAAMNAPETMPSPPADPSQQPPMQQQGPPNMAA